MTKDEVLKNLEIARKYQQLVSVFHDLLKKLEEEQVKVVATLNTGRVVDLDLVGFVEHYMDDRLDSFDVVELPKYRPLTPVEATSRLEVFLYDKTGRGCGWLERVSSKHVEINCGGGTYLRVSYHDLMSYMTIDKEFIRKQI